MFEKLRVALRYPSVRKRTSDVISTFDTLTRSKGLFSLFISLVSLRRVYVYIDSRKVLISDFKCNEGDVIGQNIFFIGKNKIYVCAHR